MSFIKDILDKILKSKNSSSEQKEMSFFEHLEELRIQIIKAIIGIIVGSAICTYYADFIVQQLLLYPLHSVGLKSQVLSPYGIVLLYMETIIIGGIIISMPYTLHCLWVFVAPGLLPNERRYISRIVFFTSICFFTGIAFGYFVLLPTALNFFAKFGTQNIDLNIALDQYISFMLVLLLGSGLIFELPMVSYFLSKLGIITPSFMRKYRKHAIILIFIIAAIVTPTPDAVTQALLGIPMILLYEISILIAVITQRKSSPQNTDKNY